jgi:hypothetical protein
MPEQVAKPDLVLSATRVSGSVHEVTSGKTVGRERAGEKGEGVGQQVEAQHAAIE